MEKLKDIKAIVEVTDYSAYYLAALIVAVIVLSAVLVYFLMQPRKRKKPTSRERALENLKNIDYGNPKKISYIFTLNIPFFETEENKKTIQKILEQLEIYKYKKDIPDMSKELKNEIKKFIKGLK